MNNTRETKMTSVASESHQNYRNEIRSESGRDEFKRCRRGLYGYKKLSGFEYLCMFVGMMVVMIAIAWTGIYLIDKFLMWITPAVEWLLDMMYGKLLYLTLGISGLSLAALMFLPSSKESE